MDDVQARWRHIRGPPHAHAGNGLAGAGKTEEEEEEEPQRHVSFTDPLVTGVDVGFFFIHPIHTRKSINRVVFSIQTANNDDDDDNNSGDSTHTKRIFYIDRDFSLEDMVLLHNIAAKWERDRWLAISTRFNDLTQRAITPEQARSAVEGE